MTDHTALYDNKFLSEIKDKDANKYPTPDTDPTIDTESTKVQANLQVAFDRNCNNKEDEDARERLKPAPALALETTLPAVVTAESGGKATATVANSPATPSVARMPSLETTDNINKSVSASQGTSDTATPTAGSKRARSPLCTADESVNLPGDILQQVKSFQTKYGELIKMADSICSNVNQWKQRTAEAEMPQTPQMPIVLRRIQDSNGSTYVNPTEKQINRGSKLGNPVTLTCFICRRYCDESKNVVRRKTSFWCEKCHMPLCKANRVESDGRKLSCSQEHEQSDSRVFACNAYHKRGTPVPPEMHLNLHERKPIQPSDVI